MKFKTLLSTGLFFATTASVHAAPVFGSVPEIDGSIAAIAVGLTVSVVALIRERKYKS